MAYMSQDRKKELAPQIKAVLKKYGMKASIAVRHHSTLLVNIKSGKLDIIGNYMENSRHAENMEVAPDHMQVNNYWLDDNYSGDVLNFLKELNAAMNDGNFDKSDIQTDYFHVGWYSYINVGNWDKPYELVEK